MTKSLLAVAIAVTLLSLCSPITTKHGHHFQESDLQQIQPGMTADAVRMALGTPATTSTVVGGNSYCSVRAPKPRAAFFKPTEVDRKVLAVYFNQTAASTGSPTTA